MALIKFWILENICQLTKTEAEYLDDAAQVVHHRRNHLQLLLVGVEEQCEHWPHLLSVQSKERGQGLGCSQPHLRHGVRHVLQHLETQTITGHETCSTPQSLSQLSVLWTKQ